MNTYLIHFGIKGQKWGVRRFQDQDGDLTEAGKKRYLNRITARQEKIGPYAKPTLDKKPTRAERRREEKLSRLSDDERRYRELKKKKFSEMSNQEVNELNNREQLRQNYKRLNPSTFAKGVAVVAGITATMMVANKFVANGKVFVKNGKDMANYFDKKFGNYYMSEINKAYNFRV